MLLGFVDAQTALGDAYASGVTGSPDHQAALGWYRKAAQAGDDLAQFKLGQSYLAGLGVAQDPGQPAQK